MLLALARSVTDRRADGGRSNSSLIKITYCQYTHQNSGRRLRGFCFFRVFSGLQKNSCSFVSIRVKNSFIKSFRMMLLALARSVTDRRAAGSRWNSLAIGCLNLQIKSLAYCRLLRGGNLCNLCDLWFQKKIRVHSWQFVVLLSPFQQEKVFLHMDVPFAEIAAATERIVVR